MQIIFLVVIGAVLWAGWALAREATLDHPASAKIQVMEDAGCSPTNNPPGGG